MIDLSRYTPKQTKYKRIFKKHGISIGTVANYLKLSYPHVCNVLNGVYRITLNSEAQLENFRKNIRPELLSHIRKTTGISSLEIDARLAESENREKKVYTDSDKLEFLVRKNPDLADFSARFGLDFDR